MEPQPRLFSPQQLEIMPRLGIRAYLSTDACMFRLATLHCCSNFGSSDSDTNNYPLTPIRSLYERLLHISRL